MGTKERFILALAQEAYSKFCHLTAPDRLQLSWEELPILVQLAWIAVVEYIAEEAQ